MVKDSHLHVFISKFTIYLPLSHPYYLLSTVNKVSKKGCKEFIKVSVSINISVSGSLLSCLYTQEYSLCSIGRSTRQSFNFQSHCHFWQPEQETPDRYPYTANPPIRAPSISIECVLQFKNVTGVLKQFLTNHSRIILLYFMVYFYIYMT